MNYKNKALVIVDWENLRRMIEGNREKSIFPGKRLKVNFNYPNQVYNLINRFVGKDEEILRILFYHALLDKKYKPPTRNEDDNLLTELEESEIFNKKYILNLRNRNFISVFKSKNGEEIRKIYPEKLPSNFQIINNGEKFCLNRISSYHFIETLRMFNNITCRLGYLSLDTLKVYYTLNENNIEEKLQSEQDKNLLKLYIPRQKLVDVLMGIDIINYSIKRLIEKIIIICNDTDILPAIKEAKRNGVKVVMATFNEYIDTGTINKELVNHFDEIRPI